MLFNSLEFALFFIVVYSLYLLLNHRFQNLMLLAASYIFYGAWDWRFLSLLVISTLVDYFCGLKVYESNNKTKRKLYLMFAVFANLSILGFFKYFNFFISNLQKLLGLFSISIQPHIINIVLPIGISFYTFQTLSYTIDVYRGEIKPTKSFLDFSLFVSFFPQLVAGPIERAKNLLTQILSPRTLTITQLYDGMFLIFWGLFQKIFVADNLATLVNPLFSKAAPYDGGMVLIAMYAFAFQVYCDFAGYSNIAVGLGKMMGFELMINFNLPFFATNPREYWKRWHISLSKWFRDYVYIPLGGNKKGNLITLRNIIITMFLAGLWHGAAWTKIIWGVYHGILLIVYGVLEPLLEKVRIPKEFFIERLYFVLRVLFFFHLWGLGLLIFRAQTLTQCLQVLHGLFFNFQITHNFLHSFLFFTYFTFFLLAVEILQYLKNDLIIILKWPLAARTAFLMIAICLVLYVQVLASGALIEGGKEFVYFQF